MYPSWQTGSQKFGDNFQKSPSEFHHFKLSQSPVIVPFLSSLWWILWKSTGTRSLRTWLQTTAPVSPPTRISCVILGTDPRPHKDEHYFPILCEFKITLQFYDDHFVIILSMCMQCCGSAMASVLIRIHLFISKNVHTNVQKPFWKKPGLLVNFGKFPCSWIRIQDSQNADPVGSGFITLHTCLVDWLDMSTKASDTYIQNQDFR